MSRVDVAIIGAGPAGTSAAIAALGKGLSAVVIDKATFPRDKTCGDGLTTSALRHLHDMGFDPKTTPSWTPITETTWRSPSGHTIDLNVPNDKGTRIAVVRRFELDAALVALARAKGADIREHTSLVGARLANDCVEVTTDSGEHIQANYVIGADGMYSSLRRITQSNQPRYLGDIHAFRQYFTNVTGPAAERMWVSFEPDILPGYIWAFPVGNGCVNLGFGVERRPDTNGQSMKTTWHNLLERDHVRAALGSSATPEEPHRAWPIPASLSTSKLTDWNGRVLFVGDAARSVDPLTGEGIAQAFETGRAAVNAIARSGTAPEAARRHYVSTMRNGMIVDHKFAKGLSRLVRHDLGARAAIRFAPLGPQRGRYAMRWVFEDNPRAALITPWRWKQRFAEKPKVFASSRH